MSFIAMQTIDISLPDSVKSLVDRQVAAGRYGSASEYVENLILDDATRQADEAELEKLLLEGLRSRPATDLTEQDWQDIRREGLARMENQNESTVAPDRALL
jgi:antitoxin ParD1/3/4